MLPAVNVAIFKLLLDSQLTVSLKSRKTKNKYKNAKRKTKQQKKQNKNKNKRLTQQTEHVVECLQKQQQP